MYTKARLCVIIILASGVFSFGSHPGWACHGHHSGRKPYPSSQSLLVVPTASQQPANLQSQAALVAKVQQTSSLLASNETGLSLQNSMLTTLQQKQLALQSRLQTALQWGNGRLTRVQLVTLGKQESAIIAQLRALHTVAIR